MGVMWFYIVLCADIWWGMWGMWCDVVLFGFMLRSVAICGVVCRCFALYGVIWRDVALCGVMLHYVA